MTFVDGGEEGKREREATAHIIDGAPARKVLELADPKLSATSPTFLHTAEGTVRGSGKREKRLGLGG